MKTYHVYFVETRNHVLEVKAKNQKEAEKLANERWGDNDEGELLDAESVMESIEETK